MRHMDVMKLIFASIALIISSVAIVHGQESGIISDWNLVWVENFDGEELDTTIWSKIPRGRPDWQNYMSDFDSCYDYREGHLILKGIVNQPHFGLKDTATFLTGGVYTKGKKAFQRGRLEIRAKFSGSRGSWPAFWLLAEEGGWPKGGEIDIMERLNSESKAYQTVHSHYTYNLKIKEPKQGSTGTIDPDGYNIYTVELGPDSLRFEINGIHTFTYPRIETDLEGQFPYDRPMYLLLDMQLGGSWVGKVFAEDLPTEMWIDWVRFYRKE